MKRSVPVKVKLAARQMGENVSSWRRMFNLTSEELAEKAAVSRTTISRVENGDPSVSFATMLSIYKVLGILDNVVMATDPYETDIGRLRADQQLPQRVRRRS